MSLLVVGSVAFDAVETPFGKVESMLGGAATYFALSASYFTKVRLVGVVGDDFSKKHGAVLEKRKIDIQGLERAAGKTFFWAGRYGVDPNDRVTLATDLNVSPSPPRRPSTRRNRRWRASLGAARRFRRCRLWRGTAHSRRRSSRSARP